MGECCEFFFRCDNRLKINTKEKKVLELICKTGGSFPRHPISGEMCKDFRNLYKKNYNCDPQEKLILKKT